MGKRYVPGPPVKFVQIAAAAASESVGEVPEYVEATESLYGLTAAGDVYEWTRRHDVMCWRPINMETAGTLVDDPTIPEGED